MNSTRLGCMIDVQPWFQDHSIGDKIVLPAVETMLLLAAHVLATYPSIDITVMEDVRFAKFLEIPPGTASLAALLECGVDADGRVQAKLLSRSRGKSMSRIKEHCEIFFSLTEVSSPEKLPSINFTATPPTDSMAEIKVDHLYRELVPFGPNYRTLQETLYLKGDEAWGRLRAPEFPHFAIDPIQDKIGSPFPLDGALHAACVLGQQAVDFVPFPVGFSRRIVRQPTRPGASYITRVKQVSYTDDELVYDVALFDDDGHLCEMVTGLRMRDVSSVFLKTGVS